MSDETTHSMINAEIERALAALRIDPTRVGARAVFRIDGRDWTLALPEQPTAAIILTGRAIERTGASMVAATLWDGSQPSALVCVVTPSIVRAHEVLPPRGWHPDIGPVAQLTVCPPSLVSFFRRGMKRETVPGSAWGDFACGGRWALTSGAAP